MTTDADIDRLGVLEERLRIIYDLRDRLDAVTNERNAAEVDAQAFKKGNEALRARLAEAPAKRDELWNRTETLTTERADARRVAKRLATYGHFDMLDDGNDVDTALAYKVEP